MILYKKIFLFQSILFGSLIVLILSLNSCINSCDNTNSTVAKIGVDSTNKPKNTWLTRVEINGVTVNAKLLNMAAVPAGLNLEVDSTVVNFFLISDKTKKDSVTYRLVLGYTSIPFLPGPDCGMDMRINNLTIKSHNFPEDKNPILSTDQVTTADAPNIKIRL